MVEVSSTYDYKKFASVGSVLVDNEWLKKDSAKACSDIPKVRKNKSNPMLPMMNEIKELKYHLKAIEEAVLLIHESTTKLLQLGKEISTDVGKVHLSINGLK